MGKIRFFCDCGKEIWDHLDHNSVVSMITVSEFLDHPEYIKCSDCICEDTIKNMKLMK